MIWLYLQEKEKETEDQEVGSKDGIVDAWYERELNWGGWGSHLGVVCLLFFLLNLTFLLAFSIKLFEKVHIFVYFVWYTGWGGGGGGTFCYCLKGTFYFIFY